MSDITTLLGYLTAMAFSLGNFIRLPRRQSRNKSRITSVLGNQSTHHRHEVNEYRIWDTAACSLNFTPLVFINTV